MKTPYKNIYNILKLNRFIVLTVVIGAVLTCVISVLMVIKLHKETVNSAFVGQFGRKCYSLETGISTRKI